MFISIPTLREEGDITTDNFFADRDISIPTLREEGDLTLGGEYYA